MMASGGTEQRAGNTEQIGRRVLRNTLSNYAGRAIAVVVGFVLTPFVLHTLGATDYGLLALAGSVVGYGALLDLGIASAVIKYVAEYLARGEPEQAHRLVATALRLYTGLGLLALLLSAAGALVFPDLFAVPPGERATATWLVLLSGLALGISIPATTGTAVLRGLQRFDLVSALNSAAVISGAAATVGVLLLGGGVLGLVAANIGLVVAMQVPTIWLIWRVAPELRFGWRDADRRLVRTVFGFSAAIFAVQVAGRMQTETDEIVIGAFLPVRAIAPYAIARGLSEFAQNMTDQFLKVLLPLAAEFDARSEQARLRALYMTGTRLTLALFLPLGCTIVILARPILTLWVGPEYADSAPLVAILTLASFINVSQWPAAAVLQGMGRHRPIAAMSIGSGVVNLALSVVLVQPFGLIGVALGTLVPTAIECLGLVLPYAMRVLSVGAGDLVREIWGPALLPAIPAVILLYVLDAIIGPPSWPALAPVAAIGMAVYGIGYLRFATSAGERASYRRLALAGLRKITAYVKRF